MYDSATYQGGKSMTKRKDEKTDLIVTELYRTGKEFLRAKKYDEAIKYFLECYKLKPTHGGTCYQLFFKNIHKKQYEEALQYCIALYHSETVTPRDIKDNNFFLFLLSMLMELPQEYKEYLKTLKFNDMSVDEEDYRFLNPKDQNQIRKLAFEGRFGAAYYLLKNNADEEERELNVVEVMIKLLLSRVISEQEVMNEEILKFINQKQYYELILYLRTKEQIRPLSLQYYHILVLVYNLLEIKVKRKIPEKVIFQTYSIFDAIASKDYEYALYLSKSYNEKAIIANTVSLALNKLLIEINQVIEEIQKEQNIQSSSSFTHAHSNDQRIIEFANFIMTGTPFEEVCKTFYLSEQEQILLILKLVQSYYIIGNNVLGDSYVIRVEKYSLTLEQQKELEEMKSYKNEKKEKITVYSIKKL